MATAQRLLVVNNNGKAEIEQDLPLEELSQVQSRGLSGASTLELRVR